MRERDYKLKESAGYLKMTVQRLNQLVKEGSIKVHGSPKRIWESDLIEECKKRKIEFIPKRKSSVQESEKKEKRESGKDDLDLDVRSIDSEDLKDLKLRYEILAKMEDIRRKRQESGRSLKEEEVAVYVAGIRESVRSRANQIFEGIATAVEGLSAAQVARDVEKRVERYLKELSELKWNDLVKLD